MTYKRKLTPALVLLLGIPLFSLARRAPSGNETSRGNVQSRPIPSPDPRSIFERAQHALAAGDYKSAENGFHEVLKLDPKSASAYVNLGVVYMRTERFDAAIKALESAKRLAPSVAGIDLNLGLAYYRKKDYSAAIPHFAQVLRADAGNYQTRYLKGMCHFVQDEYQPAVDTLEPIASQQPDDIELLFVLGIYYGKLKRAAGVGEGVCPAGRVRVPRLAPWAKRH
jgi:tetratricopeptide (TPR) repeat protein